MVLLSAEGRALPVDANLPQFVAARANAKQARAYFTLIVDMVQSMARPHPALAHSYGACDAERLGFAAAFAPKGP